MSSDFKLDALLRDVPLPSGLLERLMALPYADESGLDEVVRDMELPAGLLQRLAVIPLADDAGLDEALRSVPTPRALQKRLADRRGSRSLDRTLQITRIAMAASLIFAVTLSLGSALLLSWALEHASQFAQKEQTPPAVPRAEEKHLETSWRMLADDDLEVATPMTGASAARRDIDLAQLESAGDRARREAIARATMPAEANPLAPAGGVPVFHNNWDEMPELPFQPTKLDPHGLDWPLVKGSNRQLLIEKGFNPFVEPQANPALQTCPVPLAVEPASYELTRRYAERNELPPPNRVRTEEFLAAVDYNFPKPRNHGLGLTVSGGPSPISGEGFSLLQAGVQAWQSDDTRHTPMHLVLLVDTSTSMRWGSRMEIVRRALGGLPGLVGPQDRLSLVTFNQAAHVLVENLGHDALRQFRAAADSLTAEGSTNFVSGFREACSVARGSLGPGRPAVRMVLLTDGLLDLDPAAAEKLQGQLAEAAQQNIHLDVIDLGQQKPAEANGGDPQLAAMSQAGQGHVHRATSVEQIRWAFREIVTGRSQVVARSARLHVTFNPKAVLEYRIIGHESADWAGLLPGPLEADFREGQAATGLFEVRLNPNGADEVAKVEITWYTANGASPDGDRTLAGKTAQRAIAIIHRNQFAGTLTSSAPWLQQAAVVAYTAEVLRHSPFIFLRHPGLTMPAALHRASELSTDIDSRAVEIPSYEEFVALIGREMKAHATRRPSRD